MMLRRTRATACVVAITATFLAGCGGEEDPAPPTDQEAAWQHSGDPVDTSGLIWAQGQTVHLGDDTTIDTDETVGAFTVAGDGVYYAQTGRNTEMRFATPAGDTATGITTNGFQASPDGRYLAYVDLTTGDKDGYGTPQPNNVVLDLHTGEEVVRSTQGLESEEDDYAVFLENYGAYLVTVTDDTAYFDSGTDYYAYDLATGDGTTVEKSDIPVTSADHDSVWNPGHTWRIVRHGDRYRDTLASTRGATVTPRVPTPTWSLFDWVDDHTVLGNAFSGQGNNLGPDDSITLMTCEVPSGDCELFEDSEHTLADAQEGRGVIYPTEQP